MGICFECGNDVNMSDGYGDEYIPDKYRNNYNNNNSIIYCKDCYRFRCKNHISFKDENELKKLDLKLENYFNLTEQGRKKEQSGR